MKKIFLLLIISSFFIGCATKKPLDPCLIKEKTCLAQCKIEHPSENFKYKVCKAKCYTFYKGCKIKQKVSEGYQKTKEFIKEKSK